MNTLLSTASTSKQQTSTSTAPPSDKELSVWDLLRSGHELGQGEPPDSWAETHRDDKRHTVKLNDTLTCFHHMIFFSPRKLLVE